VPDNLEPEGRQGISPAFIGAAVLILVLLVFVGQNRGDVKVHFLLFDPTAPMWLLLLVTGALAVGAVQVAGRALRRRRRSD
jgi:uncharacterized integral membrane protein